METLTLSLPQDRMDKLKALATRAGIAPEELVRASIDNLLLEKDESFSRVAERVLAKNAELYRRLA